ncbi:MAG TPA: CPBP family intramembrane glutamic endopeptidase [Chthoniobacterales bacterium]|nr:CPBP family intramembrane glutamic endopeptidase [Chthoniobacterales bacterium]
MKDAARLVAYFAATILFGALAAPFLFWAAQSLAGHGIFPALARFDFESFFHRALLLGAILLLWPLLRWLRVRQRGDLGLEPNRRWLRHLAIGFLLSSLPVVGCELFLVLTDTYSIRPVFSWLDVLQVLPTAVVVPFIEEALFRGLFLGVLLRAMRPWAATVVSAGIFSIVHFLKAPDQTTTLVQWYSGFVSLAHSFDQFREPMLVLGGFSTLFLIGIILAHVRLATRSLWAPIGLHAGWILTSMMFAKIARRDWMLLPWLGKNLLVGLLPLAVMLVTWLLVSVWLNYARLRQT